MRIGLIGVGNMGMPLLKRLINNNYELNVLLKKDRLLENCKKFQLNELNRFIDYSSVIISVLPNSNITLDIVNNIKNNDKKYWMDLCSSCPKDVLKINDNLLKKNIEYIDTPVSGGPKAMEEGILTSVVSGPEATYKKCYDIINCYSENIYYISDKIGTSSTIKLANNTLLALNLISAAEVLNNLEKKDIDIKKALEFINTSSGRNWATMQRYPDNILTGKYDFGFSYDLHKKDVLTYLSTLDNVDNRFLLTKIEEIYRNDNNRLSDDMDHTEIVKLIK
jgi:3-hydroxyisobutyrate dehydrogenase-like beta-hydroxyacid dehydrogenase